jgi:hypothetical protein
MLCYTSVVAIYVSLLVAGGNNHSDTTKSLRLCNTSQWRKRPLGRLHLTVPAREDHDAREVGAASQWRIRSLHCLCSTAQAHSSLGCFGVPSSIPLASVLIRKTYF